MIPEYLLETQMSFTARKLPDDVKSIIVLFSNLEEMQTLLNLWLNAGSPTLPQWKDILKIHDPCFMNLLSLGYQPDYNSEVETRLLNMPVKGVQTFTEFNETDFAISVHLKINEDFELNKCGVLDDSYIAIDLGAVALQCYVHDLACVVWINHLPSGRKMRFNQNRYVVFRTGFEIECRAANGVHVEISLLNHTLQMNDFLFHTMDVLMLDAERHHIHNASDIVHQLEFI